MKWKRVRFPDVNDPPTWCETCDIGPFTIDVYEDGTYEIEHHCQGKAPSMEKAKVVALNRAFNLLSQWQVELFQLLSSAGVG